MLRGNWRPVYTAGLVVFALLGAAVGGDLYWDAIGLEGQYQRQTDHKAKEYRDRAHQRAESRCRHVPAEAIRQCVYEEYNAAEQGEHDQTDLQAQLVTSAWTRAMGIAAIIGMSVGIVGVGLVFITFRETKRAADIARDAMSADQRAWLSVKATLVSELTPGITHDGRAGYYVRCKLRIKNHGHEPAVHILSHAKVILSGIDCDLDEAFGAYCDDKRHAITTGPALFAGDDMDSAHMLFIGQDEIDAATAPLEFKMISPWVIGCVCYETSHAKGVRQTRFAHYIVKAGVKDPEVLRPDQPNWHAGNVGLTDYARIYPD